MTLFERLQLSKKMIMQIAVCYITFYFKGQHQITAIDLSKQQALDADLKAVQLINFTGN